ncbi:unnamed protein product [Lupinus luteus]|uniref:Serine/threonine-protein phosphatase 4 regulatory subunit 3-like central domain-containing protein n=1 Tax=Lupinus luteus TaxID=3873 RepID=A0AAV1XW24_LUPLU
MGAQEKSKADTNSMQAISFLIGLQRVKVYRLNNDGKWDDQGSGHAAVDYLERPEELGLFVYDEEENETILLHRISSDDIYRKQEDTIISWRDLEYATELALSFHETTGCSYIWDLICNVQRNMHFNTLNSEPFHSVNSQLRELPAVELSTLPLIIKTVVDSGIADQLRLTELILNDQEFLPKLVEVFRVCEDLENMAGLHMIFEIVKGIILLNSTPIFDRIFSDEFIVDIIGALEYDSEAPCVQNHRKFLKDHVVFKEAIPIKDPLVLSKIHQTYKVCFLKDVVLARLLDEATGANLNNMIRANNAVVVSLLKDDSTFIQELFARLRLSTTSLESKKNLICFLHEFCSLSKSLSMVQQLRLFRELMNEGIFDVVSDVLQYQDKKLVLTGADILMLFSSQDPNLLRSYVVRQEGIVLLGLLVKGMITDFEENMHCQFLEVLRSLLDSCTLPGPQKDSIIDIFVEQRDAIIDIFFEKHLGQLINVITASCPSENIADANCKSVGVGRSVQHPGGTKPEILSNICELLCFCVLHHPYRIKCSFHAVQLTVWSVNLQDEHVINYFVQNNVLKPIVDVFVADGSRYNLLNSAVLELFEFIRKESLKPLLIYIVDSFWDQLVKFEYLISIQSLKVKYEQCLDNGGIKGADNVVDPRRQIDERALEKEEEHYFNEDSDEEGIAYASSQPNEKGLQQPISNGVAASYSNSRMVDYDDDEDYRPPPKKLPESSEEGTMESPRQKRKLPSKDKGPELVKKQKLSTNSRFKDSVFSALCSSSSQAMLPDKKTATNIHTGVQTVEGKMSSNEDNQDERSNVSRSCSHNNSSKVAEDNHVEKETAASRSCSDCLRGTSDNIPMGGEDHPLVPSNSSPEMAVNGS